MREIKFRAWDGEQMIYTDRGEFHISIWGGSSHIPWGIYSNADGSRLMTGDPNAILNKPATLMQYCGLKDKNGKEIYEGDILEFADKWEWYKGSYGIKMHFADPERKSELQKQYDAEPMERRKIDIPECYEWILSSEIQTYWHVIGNIYENPELLKQ